MTLWKIQREKRCRKSWLHCREKRRLLSYRGIPLFFVPAAVGWDACSIAV
uniref:LrgA family protein n=1 Tax=Myoviridae sp. ctm8X17 TaxID=2825168 RepID=A0A8S5Q949_9CAUD|nr:MAG TPA: LrgA family protein [Myoviridae sp. ctm8X17]